MSKNKNFVLDIHMNGAFVGELIKERSSAISFKYDQTWLENGFAISRSLPLIETAYKGEPVSRYFDNLLPDNEKIRELAATKFGAESTSSFDLLKVIGKDCVGALSFSSKEEDFSWDSDLEAKTLSEKEIARRIRNLGKATPLGMDDGEEFRISIAGAQEKTAFYKKGKKWCEPIGKTPTTHIFKNSIGALGEVGEKKDFSDSVDNEWACLYIMKKMGFKVCSASIEEFEDQRVLVVKRFDRSKVSYEGKEYLVRVPQEDICQALSYSSYQKYESQGGPGIKEICKLLRASKNNEDRETFFKAIIVFDLLFAIDGHGKNFSIFIERDGFRLTPFYDVMSGYFLTKREKFPVEKLKLAMKVDSHYSFKRIFRKHYEKLAKDCDFSEEKITEMIEGVHQSYKNLEIIDRELDPNLNKKTLNTILEGMKKRAKVLFG